MSYVIFTDRKRLSKDERLDFSGEAHPSPESEMQHIISDKNVKGLSDGVSGLLIFMLAITSQDTFLS